MKNENTTIDKYGDELKVDKNWAGFNFPVKQYKTNVKDCLVEIIRDVEGVSEKDFKKYDTIIKYVGEFFKISENANNLLKSYEDSNYRCELAAELIYNKYFKKKIKENLNETKKSKYQKLQDNKTPLTTEERTKVKEGKAEWSDGRSAIWKSVDKNGKVTFITNTHRAYNTAPTLKGAISKFHNFIKGTA